MGCFATAGYDEEDGVLSLAGSVICSRAAAFGGEGVGVLCFTESACCFDGAAIGDCGEVVFGFAESASCFAAAAFGGGDVLLSFPGSVRFSCEADLEVNCVEEAELSPGVPTLAGLELVSDAELDSVRLSSGLEGGTG